MAIKKVYELAVDLKRTSVRVNIPVLVQGDSAEFRIRLLDNGAELSTEQLTGITKVSMQSGYDAQTVIQTVGTLQGSVAVFRLKKNELFRSGTVQAMVQLEDTEDRISTLRFQYQVIPDLAGNYIPGEQDITIFQRYMNDAQAKIDEMAATDVAQLAVELGESAKDNEVRKKSVPIGLNDAASDLLQALSDTPGVPFNVLSIPRDHSVTQEKTTMFVPGKNLIDPSRVSTNKNLSFSSGLLVDSPGNAASDFIEVSQDQSYIFTTTVNAFFYNADKTFHSRVAVSSANSFVPPVGAVYVRLPFTIENMYSVQLEKGTLRTPYEKYTLKMTNTTIEKGNLGFEIKVDMDKISELEKRFTVGKNIFDKSKIEVGKSLYNGNVVTNVDYVVSDFITVSPSTAYAHSIMAVAFYTAERSFISSTARGSGTFTTPSNTAFIRITCQIGEVDTAQIEKGTERTFYEPYSIYLNNVKIAGNQASPLSGKKGVSFGDSITQNATYPDIISANTGADIKNVGFGATRLVRLDDPNYPYSKISMCEIADGIASGDWSHMQPFITAIDTARGDSVYTNIFNRLKAIDFTQINFITMMYGTNDINTASLTLGELNSSNTYTIHGAMNHVITSILTKYPHIKVYVLSPMFKKTMSGATGNSDEVTRGTVYLYEVAEAIGKNAKKWHVPFKDMYNESGINVLTADYYTPDGIHPGVAGRNHLNPIIQGFLESH